MSNTASKTNLLVGDNERGGVEPLRKTRAERSPLTSEHLPGVGDSSTGAILRRIDRRLRIVRLSDRKASLTAGKSADLIRSARRQVRAGKQHKITRESLRALAVPLRTNPEWLETGGGDEDFMLDAPAMEARGVLRPSDNPGVPVRGVVLIGGWFANGVGDAIARSGGADDLVPADPRYRIKSQYALLVLDTSVNRVAQPCDFVVVLNDGTDPPRNGDLIVVTRSLKAAPLLKEISLRRLVKAGERIELRLDTTDARFRGVSGITTVDGNAEINGKVIGVFRRVGSAPSWLNRRTIEDSA